MKTTSLRWGFFGAGKCTHDFVSALKLLPLDHHKAVGIASRDSNKAEDFAEKLGIEQAFGNYSELAESDNVDIIYIGTVNSEHFHQAKLALLHGKHVLCEKPVCINRAQVEELVAIAKEKDLFFMEGFWTFFFPATRKLLEEIKQGSIGKVVQMTVEIGNKFYHLDRFSRKDIGGGTLLNHGVYGLMFAHQIFGQPPSSISASGIISGSGTDESVAITLTYRDTAQIASIICSSKVNMPGELRVIGTKGMLKLQFPFWAPTTLDTPTGTLQFDLPLNLEAIKFNNLNSSGFTYEAETVRQCILNGWRECPVVGWNASRAVMGVADEVRRQLGIVFPHDNNTLHANEICADKGQRA